MQIKVKLLLFLSSVFFCCFLQETYSQTKYWENDLVHNYYNYVGDIKKHILPVLNEKEKSILSKVKDSIEVSDDIYARSDSKSQAIIISTGLLKLLARFSIAQVIDTDTTDFKFERDRFSAFYASVYPFLNSSTPPENAAELSELQIDSLKSACYSNDFRWFVVKKLIFVYLHELNHQFQDYSKKSALISEMKISDELKDSLLFQLEIESDSFATSRIARIDVNPLECSDVISLLALSQEKYFSVIRQFVERRIKFYEFCYDGFGCDSVNDILCQKIIEDHEGSLTLYMHYQQLLSSNSIKNLYTKAQMDTDIHAIYNLADFYFKGTSVHIESLDTAIMLYELGANLVYDGKDLYGARDVFQLKSIIEYCAIMAGKVYELKMNNIPKALEYYKKASSNSTFMQRSYYDSLISRLEKS